MADTVHAGIQVPPSVLEGWCREVLQAAGVAENDAACVAASLTAADSRGISSHGAARLLGVYVRRLQVGSTRATPDIRVVQRTGGVALLDGDAGLGQVVGSEAMRLAVTLAREHGVGAVGVRNSSHFGIGAFFVEQATRAGMVGMAMSNATPNMPPAGARSRFLGTNPFAIGVPGPTPEQPIVLDMATSVVARGKIVMADKHGEPIPPGWAMTDGGEPTTNAAEALLGAVLPMGGYKGSGLAMMIDILSGVLTGAASGQDVVDLYDRSERHQDLGHFFVAIDVSAFCPPEAFQSRVERYAEQVRLQPRAPGVEQILLPGDKERAAADQADLAGIQLSAADLADLDALANELGVAGLGSRLTPRAEVAAAPQGGE
jgi:LDH2 family malate/lactate/ureidoglycolate dehydrogenase